MLTGCRCCCGSEVEESQLAWTDLVRDVRGSECACVLLREKESLCVCVCVCVCERERERVRENV